MYVNCMKNIRETVTIINLGDDIQFFPEIQNCRDYEWVETWLLNSRVSYHSVVNHRS